MRRADVIVVKQGNVSTDGSLRRLTKREIDQRMAAIAAEVVAAFDEVEPEMIEYLGEEIHPQPMNTRKFIRIMSKYLVFN